MEKNLKNITINFKKNNIIKKVINNLTLPMFIAYLSVILLSIYLLVTMQNKVKIKENTFRLHIISNSNNYNDTLTKCIITDKTQNYLDTQLNISTLNSKDKIIQTINNNSNEILEYVNNELKNLKTNYTASLKIGSIYYPDKKENFYYTMEKGVYDSIQIVLGEGNGENFWNLVFPNKENIESLEKLNNILPNISDIYTNDSNNNLDKKDNKDNKEIKIKFLEFFKTLF